MEPEYQNETTKSEDNKYGNWPLYLFIISFVIVLLVIKYFILK